MLESILAAGITSAGGNCYLVGVIPTPAIAYLTRVHHLDAGVMISASHNPFEYNGIKFFDQYGYKLPDETEDRIEEYMLKDERSDIQSRPTGAAIGTISNWTNLQAEYEDFIVQSTDVDLTGLKIVHDGANGSASQLGPDIFRRLGAEVIAIHHEPNGININDHCGSTHLESLKEAVLKNGADIGIATTSDTRLATRPSMKRARKWTTRLCFSPIPLNWKEEGRVETGYGHVGIGHKAISIS